MIATVANTLADQLQAVLAEVWRLRPSWENPEKFHESKSEIIARLKGLIAEAGALQGHAPAITAQARATLRLLETAAAPADAPDVEDAETTVVEDTPAMNAPVDTPPVELPPPATTAAPAVEPTTGTDLAGLQQAIRTMASTIAGVLSDVEKLALAAHASAAAYATDLTIPPQPIAGRAASASLAPPSPSLAQPGAEDPQTFYRRSFLLTEEGRTIAVRLWLAGLSKNDIALCFDFHSHAGAACVSAAIADFLHAHYPSEIPAINGERGKELAQRALLAIKSNTPAVPAMPVGDPKRGNGQQESKPSMQAAMPSTRQLTSLSMLTSGSHQRDELYTDAGRALVARLWIEGHAQHAIGRHFGCDQNGGALISIAIAGFLKDHCRQRLWVHTSGEKRKPFVREALTQFHADASAALSLPAELPALRMGQYRPKDLVTDSGRVHAAKLWLEGYTQTKIAQHYGLKCANQSLVSQAIAAFIEARCGRRGIDTRGEARKALLREMLAPFCADSTGTGTA